MLEIAALFDRGAAMAQTIAALTAGQCLGFREPEYRALVEASLAAKGAGTVDLVASTTRNVFTPDLDHDVFTVAAFRDFLLAEIKTVDENVRGPVSLNAVARQFQCAAGTARIWRAMSAGERQPISEYAWSDVYGAFLGGKSIAEAVAKVVRGSPARADRSGGRAPRR